MRDSSQENDEKGRKMKMRNGLNMENETSRL